VLALLGCSAIPPPIDGPDQRRHVGTIVRVSEIPTENTSPSDQRAFIGSMYGGFGVLINDLMSIRRGYTIYRVKTAEFELGVPSRERFSVGDCVVVWYPSSMDNRAYFGLGDAGIAKSSACSLSEVK
jgi:hypothetical protein